MNKIQKTLRNCRARTLLTVFTSIFLLTLVSLTSVMLSPALVSSSDGLTFWSKLNSDLDITSPQAGPGGAIVGTLSYSPVKFDNGVWLTDYPAPGQNFNIPVSVISHEKGTVETWVKITQDMFTYPDLHTIFSTPWGNNYLSLRYNTNSSYGTSNALKFFIRAGGITIMELDGQPLNYSTGDVVHVAVIWDVNGINGTNDTVRFYSNGNPAGSSTIAWTPGPLPDPLYFGRNSAGGQGLLGYLDNLKIYDYAKTDFSDRNVEGPGANQPPVLDPINDRAVSESETLTFDITATDPDGDSLTFSATNLPDGATFTGSTFSWIPGFDQADIYTGVHFEVSDGTANDFEDITITVVDVTTEEAAQELISDIQEELNLPAGTENSIVSSLESAIASFEAGQENAGVNKLEAFINKVEAQRGKKLTDMEADLLIEQAQALSDIAGSN